MTEIFLHYLWKFRLIRNELITTDGDVLKIIQPGIINTDAGPDFFDARVRINNTLWAGNVEIHICASDWLKHGHQYDDNYNNIILHVVYENDKCIFRKDGEKMPTLEIKGKFDENLFFHYNNFMKNRLWVPCAKLLYNFDLNNILSWIDKLLLKRLDQKASVIERSLVLNNFDWEQTFYQYLAFNFGFKLNNHAFELLARSLPFQYIIKHQNNLIQLEALLFGQAGFLEKDYKDEYPNLLSKEYKYLKQIYSLLAIDHHLWNFLRLRPLNFPTVRIAQFAYLIKKSGKLFSKVIHVNNIKELYDIFEVACSVYWKTHYIFDKPSVEQSKKLGRDAINLLIINTVVPFFYVYGQINDNPDYIEKTIAFLNDLPPENNSIILKWSSFGMKARSAHQSQALLQLKKEFCNSKKCLECEIGNFVLEDMASRK